MKVVKELNREDIKKMEVLLESQSELSEMLRREKARTAARKIIRPLILVVLGLTAFAFVTYALPIIQQLIIIIDSAPQ